MKKKDVKIQSVYRAKVSGNMAEVRIIRERPNGGWDAVNIGTGRDVFIRSAQRLRYAIVGKPATPAPSIPPVLVSKMVSDEVAASARLDGETIVCEPDLEELRIKTEITYRRERIYAACTVMKTLPSEDRELIRRIFADGVAFESSCDRAIETHLAELKMKIEAGTAAPNPAFRGAASC